MIPKVIHYCWFGKKHTQVQMDKLQKTISNWKNFCPDYQIIEWNEENFDFDSNRFATEAYFTKKWAFVADYARLKILEEYGGIYLDTDVELLKNFDIFLNLPAFLGFEEDRFLSTAVIGSEKHNPLIRQLLSFYQNKRSFILWDGSLRLQPNVQIITKMIENSNKEFKRNNTDQTFKDYTIFAKDVFSPKDYNTKQLVITNKTVAIHHFDGSWGKSNQKRSLDYLLFKLKMIRHKWNE